MLDVKKKIVSELEKTALPVYYEKEVTELDVPCITYSTINDAIDKYGDTLGYSDVIFQVKLWTTNVAEIATYTEQIDYYLRNIGLRRSYYTELKNDELIIGVMQYRCLVKEQF